MVYSILIHCACFMYSIVMVTKKNIYMYDIQSTYMYRYRNSERIENWLRYISCFKLYNIQSAYTHTRVYLNQWSIRSELLHLHWWYDHIYIQYGIRPGSVKYTLTELITCRLILLFQLWFYSKWVVVISLLNESTTSVKQMIHLLPRRCR